MNPRGTPVIVDTKAVISATEANQNFSRVTGIADAHGEFIIFENNKPKHLFGGDGKRAARRIEPTARNPVSSQRIFSDRASPHVRSLPNDPVIPWGDIVV
jgi:hypothetical protein